MGAEGFACHWNRQRGRKSQDWRWRKKGAQRRSVGPESHLSEQRLIQIQGFAEPRGSSPPICRTLPAFCGSLLIKRVKHTPEIKTREEYDISWGGYFTLLFYYRLRECNFEFPIIPLPLCTYLHFSLRVLTVIISDWKCRLCSGGGISISGKIHNNKDKISILG